MPGHYPSDSMDIYCGESFLSITKSTPAGRITLLNLLRKLFESFEKGTSWNGIWNIGDVMVDTATYNVEITKPFFRECNYETMQSDVMRCAEEIIPEFKCGSQYPAFFGRLQGSLNEFIPESRFNAITWKKFKRFVIAHLALKPPLTRSTFFDNLHEMLQSLGSGAKKILQAILNGSLYSNDWRDLLLKGKMENPVLQVVFEHNRKKKEKIAQERKAVGEIENKGGFVQIDNTVDIGKEAEYMQLPATQVFEETLEGLLIFSRHVKQHGSKGAKVSAAC